MSARELRTGRELNVWGDELLRLRAAPFNLGSDSVFVAYAAAAEMGCFLKLGWPLPVNIIDLFAEHRVATNGLQLIHGDSLLGAMALRNLPHMDAGDKKEMRELIMSKPTLADYSPEDRARTQPYCREDTLALEALLPRMKIDNLGRALHYGRFGPAVARIQAAGVPIDGGWRGALLTSWDDMKLALIADINSQLGFYENGHLRYRLIEDWLKNHGLQGTWPRTPTGLPSLEDETLEAQELLHPELPALRLFRELYASLNQMKLADLAVGRDGRHRFSVHPFRTITGRNAPTNFIFGPACWMRGLIKPPPGYGLAYLDFSAQEVAIWAALSGDARLAEHYNTGDVYWGFAVATGLDSRGGYATIRALVKVLFLAIGYGMGASGLAMKAGISIAEARELLALHAAMYPDFTRWRNDIVDRAYLHGYLRTSLGWQRIGCDRVAAKRHQKKILSPQEEARRWGMGVPSTELMNWPIQSTGSDLMRSVCILATEGGIELVAPVHDGFLIVSPLDSLDYDVAYMEHLMKRSSEFVTGGLVMKVKAARVLYPDRYMDDKGQAMWDRITRLYEARIRKAVA
jgi:hypothetical protein